MENRRTIREYLDNPRLLSEISIEQLQLWADTVPYAAIIYQLMAMKVVQEEHTPAAREILQRATMHSPNPDRLSRQLHKLAADNRLTDISYTSSDDAAKISESELKDLGLRDDEHLSASTKVNFNSNSDSIEISKLSSIPLQDEIRPSQKKAVAKDNELSDFSQWLLSLKKVQASDPEEESSSTLVGYSDIASETLAELLAKQGHRKRAIAMYEQLTLKYPKKSSFFAGQIQKIQGL